MHPPLYLRGDRAQLVRGATSAADKAFRDTGAIKKRAKSAFSVKTQKATAHTKAPPNHRFSWLIPFYRSGIRVTGSGALPGAARSEQQYSVFEGKQYLPVPGPFDRRTGKTARGAGDGRAFAPLIRSHHP